MSFEEGRPSIVLDSGSGWTKAGFAGEDVPRCVFPSLAEDDARCTYSIERGIVTDWEEAEKVWHRAFHEEMGVEPEDHAVLVTEAPLNPKPNCERMAQIMFESFKAKALSVGNQAALSLFASGRTSGVVLESGDGECCWQRCCGCALFNQSPPL